MAIIPSSMPVRMHVIVGGCPIQLPSSHTYDSILEWIRLVSAKCMKNGKIPTAYALRYFIQEYYPPHTDEYKHLSKIINSIMVGINDPSLL